MRNMIIIYYLLFLEKYLFLNDAGIGYRIFHFDSIHSIGISLFASLNLFNSRIL